MSRKTIVTLLEIALCGVVVFLYYGQSLRNGYIHDDHGQVETNRYIQSLMYLPRVFTGCIWESAVGDCKQTYYYRPMQSLSYMVTYAIAPYPILFHAVNLLYFTVIVWGVYRVVVLLFRSKPIGVVTAFLFALHPLNTETVNWIATVPELLYTGSILFATASWYAFRKSSSVRTGLLSVAWFAAGIFSKEPAFFLPVVLISMDALMGHFRRDTMKYTVGYYGALGVIAAVYMAGRFWVLGGLGQDPSSYQVSLLERLYIAVSLFGAYLAKVVWPHPLNLFYPFHTQYVIDIRWIVSLVSVIGAVSVLVWAVKKKRTLVVFSIVWYMVFLFPSLVFISSIGENLFAERHVFASTIGACLLLSSLVVSLWKKRAWMRAVVCILGIVYCVFSFQMVRARTRQWQSDKTIYADTLQKSPDADLIRYNLAHLSMAAGDTTRAKQEYLTIVERGTWRGMAKVYTNLGEIERNTGNLKDAKNYFERAVSFDPTHVEALNNLGAMAQESGAYLSSLSYLCVANELNPSFPAVATNYDRLMAVIATLSDDAFSRLVKGVISPDGFLKLSDTALIFQTKRCEPGSCLLSFLPATTEPLPFFSFLVFGTTDAGTIVRPRRIGYQQRTGAIVVDVDSRYQYERVTMVFPLCHTRYLSVEAF